MAKKKKKHVKEFKNTNFNRQRADTDTLRTNCKKGYIFEISGTTKKGEQYKTAAGQMQFHHALPVSSMQDSAIDYEQSEELDFIHNCMASTEWDINHEPNLIGLPTRKPYIEADKKTNPKPNKKNPNPKKCGLSELIAQLDSKIGESGHGSIPDLPCHLSEHPVYTEEVIINLNDTIWSMLKLEREECEDKGKSIKDLLEGASKHWREFLQNRGKGADSQGKGAAECWVNRGKPGYENIWYIPFSMNPGTPQKIMCPPNYNARDGKVREWLDTLITKLT